MNNLETDEASSIVKLKSFFSKLVQGELGLAKTFWIFGLLIQLMLVFIISTIPIEVLTIIGLLLILTYEIIVIFGVWRAATKYEGFKLWAILAKIVVIFWLLNFIKLSLVLFGLLGLLITRLFTS